MCVLTAVLGLVICVFLILDVYNELTSGRPWPKDAALSYEWRMRIMAVGLPLTFIGCMVFAILFVVAALRFARGGAQVVMTDQELFFPATPGAKTGRTINWNDVQSITEITQESCPERLASYLALSRWTYGNPLFVKIDLWKYTRVCCKHTGPWRIVYWFEQFAMRNTTRKYIVETVHADQLSHGQAVTAISRFSTDRALRERYGHQNVRYTIGFSAAGEIRFDPT